MQQPKALQTKFHAMPIESDLAMTRASILISDGVLDAQDHVVE